MMMKYLITLALVVASDAFSRSTAHLRRSSIKMGLAVGQPFPATALKKWQIAGKPAVIYFYGADESPSCTKECSAFSTSFADFKALKCEVVGVRNEKVFSLTNL